MFLISTCREEKKIDGDLLWCLVILLKYLVIYYSEVVNYCSTYVVINVFIMVVTSWIAFVYILVRTETLYCMGA